MNAYEIYRFKFKLFYSFQKSAGTLAAPDDRIWPQGGSLPTSEHRQKIIFKIVSMLYFVSL